MEKEDFVWVKMQSKRERGQEEVSNKWAKQREPQHCKCKIVLRKTIILFTNPLHVYIYTSYLASIFANLKNRNKDYMSLLLKMYHKQINNHLI